MFTKINSLFESLNKPSLDYLNNLPEIYHTYGQPQSNFDYPVLMTYKSKGEGKISFYKNVEREFPEFASDVVKFIQSTTKLLNISPSHIQIIRTIGSIPKHTDEIRKCCFNIGLHNSSLSSTHCFEPNEYFTCKDNEMYLLDVANSHAVFSASKEPRFLVSYGMLRDYSTILNMVNNNN
jgi:hypothetical protein